MDTMSLAQHQGLEAPHLPADLVLRRRHGGQFGVYGDDTVKRPFWRRPDHFRIDLRDHSRVSGGRKEGKERDPVIRVIPNQGGRGRRADINEHRGPVSSLY